VYSQCAEARKRLTRALTRRTFREYNIKTFLSASLIFELRNRTKTVSKTLAQPKDPQMSQYISDLDASTNVTTHSSALNFYLYIYHGACLIFHLSIFQYFDIVLIILTFLWPRYCFTYVREPNIREFMHKITILSRNAVVVQCSH